VLGLPGTTSAAQGQRSMMLGQSLEQLQEAAGLGSGEALGVALFSNGWREWSSVGDTYRPPILEFPDSSHPATSHGLWQCGICLSCPESSIKWEVSLPEARPIAVGRTQGSLVPVTMQSH
jgi:hypothetical protein